MKMKPILLAAACAASLSQVFAGGEGWTHDFAAAKKQAAAEKKNLLVDFTGSDWCGWCIKLNEEVFQHDPFKEGVKDKFVLVELDYPRDESKVSKETKAQNEELKEKYAIQGYPTILLTDEEGKPFARTGYQAGGPEKYVEHLDKLLEARATRDASFAKANESKGVEKAKALVAALDAMKLEDAMVATFYGDTVAQIKEADPKDESGFVGRIEAKKKFAEFEAEVNGFASEQDHKGALAFVEKTLAAGTFEGEQKQQVTLYKGMILAQSEKFAEALTALDAAKECAPDTELAGRIDQFKAQISQMQAKAEAAEPEEAPKEAPDGE